MFHLFEISTIAKVFRLPVKIFRSPVTGNFSVYVVGFTVSDEGFELYYNVIIFGILAVMNYSY